MREKTWCWVLGLCLSAAAVGCAAAGSLVHRTRKREQEYFADAEQPDTEETNTELDQEHTRRNKRHE